MLFWQQAGVSCFAWLLHQSDTSSWGEKDRPSVQAQTDVLEESEVGAVFIQYEVLNMV